VYASSLRPILGSRSTSMTSGEHMDAKGPRLGRGGRVDRPHQIEVERTADGKTLRKNSAARKHGAVGSLFILQQRNLQPCVRQGDFLQLVEVLRLLAGTLVAESHWPA